VIIEVFHLWLILVTDPNQDMFGSMAQMSNAAAGGAAHSDAALR
jgi:hypothetical protein